MDEPGLGERLEGVAWEETPCPLCGRAEASRVCVAGDLLHGLPGRFQLMRCRSCDHVYLNPRPTPDSIGRYYPADYSPHASARNCAGEEPQPGPASPLVRRTRWIPGLRSVYYWLKETCAEVVPPVDAAEPRALELGCAGGRFLEILRRQGWQAEGLELAEAPVAEARRRGFRVHQGAFRPGLYEAASFDAVFAWMVLEHLHDPPGALREIHRLLKPGGRVMLSVPNWGCWEPRVLGRYWYSLQLPTHLHQFTPRSLRRVLSDSGFEQIRVIHQRNVFNLLGSLGLWLREKHPDGGAGPQLLEFIANPSVGGQLALAPIAKLLAWSRQGGRLTVTARSSPTVARHV